MLLACVALGDLASYENLHHEADCMRSIDRPYGDTVQVGIIGAFIIVKSDVFIRFNLRRQV